MSFHLLNNSGGFTVGEMLSATVGIVVLGGLITAAGLKLQDTTTAQKRLDACLQAGGQIVDGGRQVRCWGDVDNVQGCTEYAVRRCVAP